MSDTNYRDWHLASADKKKVVRGVITVNHRPLTFHSLWCLVKKKSFLFWASRHKRRESTLSSKHVHVLLAWFLLFFFGRQQSHGKKVATCVCVQPGRRGSWELVGQCRKRENKFWLLRPNIMAGHKFVSRCFPLIAFHSPSKAKLTNHSPDLIRCSCFYSNNIFPQVLCLND